MRLPVNFQRLSPRRSAGRPALPFPASLKLRLAQVVEPIFFDPTPPFALTDLSGLQSFRPQVLTGNLPDLAYLSGLSATGKIDLASVDRAIFVSTPCGRAPLDERSRSGLWHAFKVPVFELFTSYDGSLIASECEAHEGWHLEPLAIPTVRSHEVVLDFGGKQNFRLALHGVVSNSPCPCGRTGVRLLRLDAPAGAPDLAATA